MLHNVAQKVGRHARREFLPPCLVTRPLVEAFTPWDLFEGTADLAVEPEVEPAKP